MYSGLRFLDHPGEMARRLRDADWGDHALGPIGEWPQPLRFAINICLGSSFPTAIYWGEDAILIYNDAWAPIAADRHPWALGRNGAEVWSDIWNIVGPQIEDVMETARGFATYDQMLPMERGGVPRETYWNYSFTPIRDEHGRVSGVLNQGNETTRAVMAERRRTAQNDRLREIVWQAPGAIALLHGPNHVFEIANEAYLDMVGRDDLMGRTLKEVMPEVESQGFVELLDQVFRSGKAYRGESVPVEFDRGPDSAPDRRIIDFIYQPLKDAGGTVTDIFVEANDVTEKVAALDALRKTNDAQRFVYALAERQRAMDDPHMVMTQTAATITDRLQADRAGFLRLTPDRNAIEMIGGWSNERLSLLSGSFPIGTMGDTVRDMFASGRTLVVNDAPNEPKFADTPIGRLSPSGIAVPLMRGGRWQASLYVSQSEPRVWTPEEIALAEAVAEISWDSVERVEAVAGLRESEAKFRAITNSIDPMVWSTRPDGYHDFYNARWYEFTGVACGSTDGEGWNDLLHPDDRAVASEHWEACLVSGEPYRIEYRLRHHSGEWRWVLARAQPVRDEQGEITRWFGTCIDIQQIVDAREILARSREELEGAIAERSKQLMAAEEKLRQAQKMEAVGQLTGGIAHDFNNMLAVVIGALDLMERKLERGGDDVKRYVVAARDGATRAASLTQRLLAFSRQSPLAPQAIDVAELVRGMSDLLVRTLGAAVTVETRIPPGNWSVTADPSQLENCIVNLAVNARDAMPNGGRLTIATANRTLTRADVADQDLGPGDYVEISVSDTGCGMLPEVAERAFEPFFTTKEVGKGTGLGLSQIFGFARQSGGDVQIDSEAGSGTTVRIVLPRNRRRGGAPPGSTGTLSGDAEVVGGTETLLVVEDEERVRAFSVEALRGLGYTVAEAANGDAALGLIAQGTRPDLLFTDVIMPGMTGRELARRAGDELPALNILYTSGYTRDAMAQASDLEPAALVLPKPFGIADLARAVRHVLDMPARNKDMDADAASD